MGRHDLHIAPDPCTQKGGGNEDEGEAFHRVRGFSLTKSGQIAKGESGRFLFANGLCGDPFGGGLQAAKITSYPDGESRIIRGLTQAGLVERAGLGLVSGESAWAGQSGLPNSLVAVQ
jgi:hypothetical protein